MMTMRCTRKLLKRMSTPSAVDAARPTTQLGDWYADILFTHPHHLVICTSERSLLSVLVHARDLSSLVPRFTLAVRGLLTRLDIPSVQVDAELAEMVDLRVGPTASRVVLGSMNDLIFQCRWLLAEHGHGDLERIALELAEVPCGPIEYTHPGQAARELLRAA